jgi:tight adherence protein C
MEWAGLVFALVLVGIAVVSFARALAAPAPRRGRSTVDQIVSYGFENDPDLTMRGGHGRSFADVAASLGGLVSSRSSSISEETIRNRMIAAGWYDRSPLAFVGVQVITAAALLVVWVALGALSDLNTFLWLIGVPVAALVGWRLPSIFLDRVVNERFKAIDAALPGFIDLLVVAVEAGMGFVAALRLAARELDGPLAQEMRLTLQEQTMGLTTAEALEETLRRVGTPGIRAFVRAIVQGETLGISIGVILRNLADQMRKQRKAIAEEKAQKAPVKMLFPLVFLIFPAMFVVILLPAMIAIADTLGT